MIYEILAASILSCIVTFLVLSIYYDRVLYPRLRASFWAEMKRSEESRRRHDHQVAIESLGFCGGSSRCPHLNIGES